MELTLGRFGEIAIYSLVNLIPYLCIALTAFRDDLRFHRMGTMLLILALCVVQIFFGLCATTFFRELVGLISLLDIGVYFGFFLLAARASFGRLSFILLSLCNFGNMIVYCSKCAEGFLFPEMAVQPYRWTYTLCMVGVQALFLTPMLFVIRKWVSPVIRLSGTDNLWRSVWLVPLTFYVTWFYATYYITMNGHQQDAALQPTTSLYMFILNVAYILVYRTILQVIRESSRSAALEARNHELQMRGMQYEHLEERIEETRRARHDLRQHYSILLSYLDQGKLTELRRYIEECRSSQPLDTSIVYCENNVLNTVVVFYCDQALQSHIDTEVELELPEVIQVQDSDLTVLFGNLLENAVEACKRQTEGTRFIRLRAGIQGEMLVLTLDNSYSGEIRRYGWVFRSSKRPREGVGIQSVRAIARKYDGFARFEYAEGVFHASAALHLSGMIGPGGSSSEKAGETPAAVPTNK